MYKSWPQGWYGENTGFRRSLLLNSGYWHLYRYNPLLEKEGKNPFTLDSKNLTGANFQGFPEVGSAIYITVKSFPAEAEVLFKAAEENSKWRYKSYQRLAAMAYERLKQNKITNQISLKSHPQGGFFYTMYIRKKAVDSDSPL